MSDESATFTINIDGCCYNVEWPRLPGDDSQQDPDNAAVYTTMGDLVGHIEPLTVDGFQAKTDVIAAAQAFLQAADATDTHALRDDIRDYIKTLEKRIADKEEALQKLTARSSEYSVGYYEGSRCTLRQVSEELRDLIAADEPEEAGDE